MNDVRHDIIRRAWRRATLRRSLDRGGAGFAAGLAAALVVLVAGRLAGASPAIIVLVVIAAAGFLIGAATALLPPLRAIAVARAIDEHFDLRDRLATATWIDEIRLKEEGGMLPPDAARTAREPGFADLVRDDARRHVRGLDVAAAMPLRATRSWLAAAGLALALAAAAWLVPVPTGDRVAGDGRAPRGADPAAPQADPSAVAARIDAAASALREEGAAADSPEAREALRVLDDLAAQLTRADDDGPDDAGAGDARPDDAAARSAAALDDLADRLGAQADRDAAAADELTRRFAGIEAARAPSEAEGGGPIEAPMHAEELRERLRRGELGPAAEALTDLLEEASARTEEERRAIADAVRDVAGDAERAAAATKPEGETAAGDEADRLERLRRILRDGGVDEEALRDVLDRPDAQREDIERALDEAGLGEEQRRELARELEDARDERALDEQVQRDATEVTEALRRAADAIEKGEPPPPPPAPSDAPRDEPQRGTPPGETSGETRTPPDQQGRETKPAPDQQGRETTTAADQQGRETAPGAQARPAPGGAEPAPGAPRDEAAGAAPRNPRPDDVLRELAERGRRADDSRRLAERARAAASTLAEDMTEEERRRWSGAAPPDAAPPTPPLPDGSRGPDGGDRAGREPAEPGAPPPFNAGAGDTIDLTGDDATGDPALEWLGDGATGAAGATARSRSRLESAQQAARRAVEEEIVPRRYHRLIRRYFERLPETAAEARERGGDPAGDAERRPGP
jgi:hypothetical protein